MRIITDLHIHSGYARACSKLLTLENIDVWCQKKGIGLVGVADFTHPERFKEIKNNLVEVGQSGLYKFSGAQASTLFIMSTELSLIYRHRDKTRRIHMCVFLSNLEAVDRFNQALTAAGGKLAADGRPILGMSCKQILTIIKEVDEQGFVVPAHAWTPWFAIFGSKSGYDSLEECFEELTPEVKAIETGLSSSPTMNRRLSSLDKINLISNSDSHSLANIGRNANVFDLAAFSYEKFDRVFRI
jgi:PHP family Zn ribbon phosphoesterase